jgi:hypothetical protein
MGVVYIVRNESDGLYKIGRTLSFRERMLSLRKELGVPLRVCWVILTNNSARLELHLHRRRFRHRHVRGEWFALTPGDLASVSRVRLVNYKDMPPVVWPTDPGRRGSPRRYRMSVGDVIEPILPPRRPNRRRTSA